MSYNMYKNTPKKKSYQLVDLYDSNSKSLDIRINGMYPSNVLSNLYHNKFRLDGVDCSSMEGFLQSLKQKDKTKQRTICSTKGKEARKHSTKLWQTEQIVWWQGQPIDRQSNEYQKFLRRAYQAMFDQNEQFRAALMQTRGIILIYSCGEEDSYKTIITEQEFCQILTEIRDNYDKRDKGEKGKKHIIVEDKGELYEVSKLEKNYIPTSDDEVLHLASENITDWKSTIKHLD